VRYGFAIDQRTCIGCHACTVACKTEHEVPVGQFRTWVKYVDSGTFPETTRNFAVLRCNHCTDAPCVTVCPTSSLFTRDDGIVDFDRDRCIGCKSCLQACPYDALYIDDDTHTAAKCNFCAHRIDQGLEPACVVVCPTESIWVGDISDADSPISQFLSQHDVDVRAPEQGTGPNTYYVGASPLTLEPLAAPVKDTYIWAQPDALRLATASDLPGDPATQARTTLNTAHPRVWGWKVSTYLWTKSVGAGAAAVGAALLLTSRATGALVDLWAPGIGLAGIVVTALLLIADLKRPERFLYLLTKPHWTSWLVRGGVALAAFAAVTGLWLLAGLLDVHALETVCAWLAFPAAVAAAGYTAFLFGQCEGRDLWQSPWLFWHLLAQALMAGAAALALAYAVTSIGHPQPDALRLIGWCLMAGALLHAAVAVVDVTRRHPTANAATAARMITHGRYASAFWWGSVAVAVVTALLALWFALAAVVAVAVVAGVIAQVSLLVFEVVFVRAGQDVPLS
jgi:Fe-S-cluster-containing dehydrogenase component/formate-dependent nitrite reductase membrane component NrfD